ncbi:MAG: alpha/beta hydrolase [Candidatus Altiarchaeota archaeon]|nr:alpha/beta hydrolase [Candidatus Altiarchaeota archaeon]
MGLRKRNKSEKNSPPSTDIENRIQPGGVVLTDSQQSWLLGEGGSEMTTSPIKQLESFDGIDQYEIRHPEITEEFSIYGRLFRKSGTKPSEDERGALLIPGITSNGGTFAAAIKALLEDAEYDWAVTVNTPGHYGSTTKSGKVNIEDYTEAMWNFMNFIYSEEQISGDMMISGHSGHAAIALEMYNEDYKNFIDSKGAEGGKIKGAILVGPAYHPRDSYFGRWGPIVAKLFSFFPDRLVNVAGKVVKNYAKNATSKEEGELHAKRKVLVKNKEIYEDIMAMKRYHDQHKGTPFLVDPEHMNVAIIKPLKDKLTKNVTDEKLYAWHGPFTKVIHMDHKGHSPQKTNPLRYALMHKEVIQEFEVDQGIKSVLGILPIKSALFGMYLHERSQQGQDFVEFSDFAKYAFNGRLSETELADASTYWIQRSGPIYALIHEGLVEDENNLLRLTSKGQQHFDELIYTMANNELGSIIPGEVSKLNVPVSFTEEFGQGTGDYIKSQDAGAYVDTLAAKA